MFCCWYIWLKNLDLYLAGAGWQLSDIALTMTLPRTAAHCLQNHHRSLYLWQSPLHSLRPDNLFNPTLPISISDPKSTNWTALVASLFLSAFTLLKSSQMSAVSCPVSSHLSLDASHVLLCFNHFQFHGTLFFTLPFFFRKASRPFVSS